MDEMNMETLQSAAERLMESAASLERTVAAIAEKQVALAAEAESRVSRIVATVETQRETELERKLEEAEAKIAELVAAAESQSGGRKTLPAGVAGMVSKQGVAVDSIDAASVDGALSSLSIEQRIAVKAELIRAGLLNPAMRS